MPDIAPAYAELHCISNFSFLRGASRPEELVRQAHELTYSALALTDECSLAGVVRAHSVAKECGMKLIIGSEFSLDDGLRLVLLARDRSQYGDLSQLISKARRAGKKGSYFITRQDVIKLAKHNLVLWLAGPDAREDDARWFRKVFPERSWIAVSQLRVGQDQEYYARLEGLGRRQNLPLVATGDVHMHVRQRRALQDTLTAIRLNQTISQLGHRVFSNGERHLRARSHLARLYPRGLLEETTRIADLCHFSLDELRYEYPEELAPEGESLGHYLRRLVVEGMKNRWPEGVSMKVQNLVEHELKLIEELKYEAYFLTVYDIVRFARSQGILCQGRGSAANSSVCFCLGITEVDPSRIETLFERFISKERNEPPDIDVDFEHERREEVIQYIYRKYSRERAALTATIITYRPRSAIRDVGKALGLSLEQVDRMAKNFHWWDGKNISRERLQEAGFDPDNAVLRRVVHMSHAILGFPRHLSQHVGGFVISRGPLSRLVPIENAAMEERTVIQWDKDDLDALGLLKIDCLGLGMLSVIRKALELMSSFYGSRFTVADIPAEDPDVYKMIQKADTLGVFQIESRAQMAMLPRLRPACFYDLVIEVAIVRPGPIQGEMVHPYLRRRQGLEAVTYPSEDVRQVLERTLGVPIFQEQVIKLAMVAAGFTPGEADQLRRSMAAWRRRGGLEHFEQRLIAGMAERGYSETFARQIFQQILGFGEYGFPESHAASFALLAYISAWIKCHEPAVFTCALLNSQPMGFYAPAQLVRDARDHGVTVRPVDVNESDWDCNLENDHTTYPVLRLGLNRVKGLSQAGAVRVMKIRSRGRFKNIRTFIQQTGLGRRDLEALAAADALASLAGHRHRAYWDVAAKEPELTLLKQLEIQEASPLLVPPTEGENIQSDYTQLGLSLRRHPLALLRTKLTKKALLTLKEAKQRPDGQHLWTAGLVIMRQRPGTATGVVFVTLEDETDLANVIVWSHLVEKQRRELLAAKLLAIHAKVQREGEVIHLIAQKLQDLSFLLGTLSVYSRDFH